MRKMNPIVTVIDALELLNTWGIGALHGKLYKGIYSEEYGPQHIQVYYDHGYHGSYDGYPLANDVFKEIVEERWIDRMEDGSRLGHPYIYTMTQRGEDHFRKLCRENFEKAQAIQAEQSKFEKTNPYEVEDQS